MNDDSADRQYTIYRELVEIKNSCEDPEEFLIFLRAAAEMLGTDGRSPEASPGLPVLTLTK